MIWFLLPLILLFGSISLSSFAISVNRFGLIPAKEEFLRRKSYYCVPLFLRRLFPKEEWDNLFVIISFSKQIARLTYAAATGLLLVIFDHPFSKSLIIFILMIAIALVLDLTFRLLAKLAPKAIMRLMTPFASFFILLFLPLTYPFLKFLRLFSPFIERKERLETKPKLKEKILEIVHESDVSEDLTLLEQKLITSVATFKDRIVREIMVPRIDIFSLPSEESISSAAQKFIEEGYSRIPVYQESVDQMIGVVYYKDLLKIFLNPEEWGDPATTPIEKIAKPLIYTPETKKISTLLTEFRHKQMHMAIVVDEYGGTEGIISIEDILEELVGEIADEYDIDEERLYTPLADGAFLIEARMTVNDIERELGVTIPQAPEYDTLGGYIFHKAGSIPDKGFKIHHDNFDLEVMDSDERSIDTVKLMPPSDKSPSR